MAFPILTNNFSGLLISEVFNPLLGHEMKFDPKALAVLIPQAIGMGAKAMHMTVAGRNAPITHGDGYLMQGLWQQRPKIPIIGGAAQVGAGVTLDRLIQIWKLAGITDKKYRGVITHHVPNALVSIKLQGKATNIALGIGGTALTSHGAKAGKEIGFLAHLAKN